jgi:type II secretory pathway pseudopilin PulG
MADRDARTGGRENGFTLAEMLAALGILLFGITALIGALTSSIAQRRSTDALHEATALCEFALHRLQHEAVQIDPNAESDLDLRLAPLQDQVAESFPGMTWSAETIVDPDRPDVWLVKLRIQWLEEGEATTAEFLRILPRQLPLGQRVLRFRESDNPDR